MEKQQNSVQEKNNKSHSRKKIDDRSISSVEIELIIKKYLTK